MIFWCGRKQSYQESGHVEVATRDIFDPHHFRHSVRRYQQGNDDITEQKLWKEQITEDWLLARWNAIRETYSARSFTFARDRERAIMGTAKVFDRIIGANGVIDIRGQIRRNLQVELLWFLDLRANRTPKPLITFSRDQAPAGQFPSWSWLNLWPVSWPALGEPLPDVSVRIVSDKDDKDDSVLKIRASMLKLRLVDASDSAQKLAYEDGSFAKITLRLDSPTQAGLDVTCVPLARGITVMWWEQEVLLLRCEGKHYVRIGVGSMPEHDSEEFMKHMSLSKEAQCITCL
jgi:hypothetical protein